MRSLRQKGFGRAERRRVVVATPGPAPTPTPSAPDFLPTMSVAPSVVYGQGQMVSTYSGPALRVVRASDSTTLDIPNASRALDVSGVASFGSGTTMAVDLWYDQSAAAGGNATQTTAADRPVFRTENVMGGAYPITVLETNHNLQLPAISTTRNSVTVLAVYATPQGTPADGSIRSMFALGTSATATSNLTMRSQGAIGGSTNPVGNTQNSGFQKQNLGSLRAVAVVTGKSATFGDFGANAAYHYADGAFDSTGSNVATSTALTGGRIGATAASELAQMQHCVFYAVYPGILTAADIASFTTWAGTRFGVVARNNYPQLHFLGDSITACTATTSHKGRSLEHQTQALLTNPLFMPTTAVSGTYMATIYSTRATQDDVYDATRLANYFTLLGGSNDLDLTGDTAASIYANITAMVSYMLGVGYTKAIVGTVIARNWNNAAKETRRTDLNTLIRNGAAANNYTVADYGAISAMIVDTVNGTTNATYYVDGVHPNEAGYALMAPVLAAAVQAAGIDVPHLTALTINQTAFVANTATTVTISGAATGSTLTSSALPTGLTLNSAARTLTWAGTTDFAQTTFTLTETLAGAVGSPKVSSTFTIEGFKSGSFAADTFTAANGAAVNGRTAPLGGTWNAAATIQSNRLYASSATNPLNIVTPPSADYSVEAVLTVVSNLGTDSIGIYARSNLPVDTFYCVRFSASAANFVLFKSVAGATTTLGTYADAFTTGTRKIRLTCTGTTITMFVDAGDDVLVSRASVTDSAVAAAGYPGLRLSATQTTTTGRHLDDWRAFV